MKSDYVAMFKESIVEHRLPEIAIELGYDLHEHRIVLFGEHAGTRMRRKLRNPR